MLPHKNSFVPPEQISPLVINRLNGRILKIVNPKKKRQIMLIYGHHSSIERYYGFAEDLSQYGTVIMPDLPGFGGMDSMYKIGEEASIDTLADYLAAVVKLQYKKQRFTLAGFSIGFAIATRMLQKYPEIAKQVDLLFSVAGFTHEKDFKFSKTTHFTYKYLANFFTGKVRSLFFRYVCLNTLILKTVYRYMPNARPKFRNMSRKEIKDMIRFEVELWHNNDVRTYMRTAVGMLTLDLTRWKVNLPVRHISLGAADQYFDNDSVATHMREIYSSLTIDTAIMDSHMPSVIANKDETVGVIPKASRNILARQPK